jgi:hypothetical protein
MWRHGVEFVYLGPRMSIGNLNSVNCFHTVVHPKTYPNCAFVDNFARHVHYTVQARCALVS